MPILREIPKKCKFRHLLRFNVPLAEKTGFRTGGIADVYFEPTSIEELDTAICYFFEENIPVSIIGGGTNILVADKGIRGVVVSLQKLRTIQTEKLTDGGFLVTAESGVLMQELIDFCIGQEFAGLENFGGLPGTVGGAAYMNARCYEKSISDVFYSARTLSFFEKRCILDEVKYHKEDWDYKKSPFQTEDGVKLGYNRPIILSVSFLLTQGIKKEIEALAQEKLADRTTKGHFRAPSGGSTFKNNRNFGKPSGKIIDEAGLRGLRVGGAQVAPWHGNFIINEHNATAADIRTLIETVQRKIFESNGIRLEPEILYAGEWN
ncbi:UDP-N-acetylmuramate dehydrogenase [Treponema phagedenis]|uniref:UDP-N-acetylmuramate dehydrogenase n=1 Tax=Treponema phagedenis TaxID=162 RepID=UPI0015814036|nr:UDP-N-acetylmuramate dehydrogenase [Treponema phagedenis]NVP25112.1 UDP-N-acetylmuramate dehydrogenase [Treponema phagedenis]QKS91461.1 UDP-N-acetylmuramate dehydrogenase [Treponema phagedenis]QLC59193.1 UDP-N-acetylmuramate dehydrogenase [Treponema phagedenis]